MPAFAATEVSPTLHPSHPIAPSDPNATPLGLLFQAPASQAL